MRKLMRSISPFSKKNVPINDPGPSVPLTNEYSPAATSPKPTWSVEGINFLQFLQIFYERYNPEKLSSIDFIYQEYKGEEMVLIYELAEKYQLSHDAMQNLLNLSKNSPPTIQNETSPKLKNVLPSSSSTNGSIQSEPQELHSVVAPNWQSKRPERTSSRNVSPYRPELTNAFKQLERKDDAPPKAAPMSLQDIIQTTRQNDLLAKKSVRFSVSDPELDDQASDNNSSQSGPPSSLLAPRRVPNFGTPTPTHTPSSSSLPPSQLLQVNPSTSLQGGGGASAAASSPVPTPSVNITSPKLNGGYPTIQATTNGASSLQARIRSSLGPHTANDTDNGINGQLGSQMNNSTSAFATSTPGSTAAPFGRIPETNGQQTDSFSKPFPSHHNYESHGMKSNSKLIDQETAIERTNRLKELEGELTTMKFKLQETENEREDLLKMLEDSWNSPQQILKIISSYLEKYDRHVEFNLEDEQNSTRSSLSQNMKMDDLEGRRAFRSERTLEINPQLRTNQEKPYMLGTVSSVKRGMEAVLGTNVIPTSRESSPSTTSRGRSPLPHNANSKGRWIRPSSADRSQKSNRSSSPASSITDVSSRYRGYTPPSRDHSPAALDSQFQQTKQRLQQETNQERQNHDLDRSKYEKHSKLFDKEKTRVSKQLKSPSPGRLGSSPLRGGEIDDWVTCIDPKTQRKYYYSKSRKVSSWTLPNDPNGENKISWTGSSSAGTSRTIPGSGSDSRNSTPNQSRPSSREKNYPQRAPSPTGSFTSTSSQNTGGTRERSNSSSIPIGGGWFEANDPQTGRTYWFNRTTRQSTWKKPTDIESS